MDLSQFQWKNRLLFLFAPNRSHPLFDVLKKSIANQQAEVVDRDLVIFEILESGTSRMATSDLDPQVAQSLWDKFDVRPGRFTVILVGKDGGIKLNRQDQTRLEDIFALIDAMPMRRQEMMKRTPKSQAPADADARRAVKPVICYPVDTLPKPDMATYAAARKAMELTDEVIVPPRDARIFRVPSGNFFRIVSVDGPQVGDLNLWSKDDLSERFYSGKTRALHGTHLSTGDQMWSSFPHMRPMATITYDTLDWYGFDADGGGVHDVIGTRCDPYTNRLLSGQDYHHCCHSNLTRALASETGLPLHEAEVHVHDVLNVFMCTGFTHDKHQYFMKASPVRPGDYIEFFAEIDLLGALSTCPGGDCSTEHSSDTTACFPLKVEIHRPALKALEGWVPPEPSAYSRSHGV